MAPRADPERADLAPRQLIGRPGAPGLGVGPLVHLASSPAAALPQRAAPATSGGAAAEQVRLRAALTEAEQQLERLARSVGTDLGEEIGAIFEAQAMFTRDPSLVDPALALIAAGGVSAESGFTRAAEDGAASLAAIDDEYLRQRAADVRDVARRVIAILQGRAPREVISADGSPAVVAAEELDASEVAILRPELVVGIGLAAGAQTGHAAIVARAMGIPLVLALGPGLAAVPAGTLVVVDGDAGALLIAPSDGEIHARWAAQAAAAESFAGERGPSRAAGVRANGSEVADTLPKLGVRLAANIGSVREAAQAHELGAQGIGLVRTELLFLGRTDMPGLDEQRLTYASIRRQMPDQLIVFRTLDIGGDKPGPLAPAHPEANPALGVRGLRLGLRHPDVLITQLRALLEAAAGEQLDVMFPMIATMDEVRAARAAMEAARQASLDDGRGVAVRTRLGIMVEVPSAAVMAQALADEVDFFSVGTNDLAQYTLAADRTHPELAELTSALQPAVLRLIRDIAAAALSRGISVSVCGEAAGDPRAAPIFIGLGVEALSVAPTRLPALRRGLAPLSAQICRAAAEAALTASTIHEVRAGVDAVLSQV